MSCLTHTHRHPLEVNPHIHTLGAKLTHRLFRCLQGHQTLPISNHHMPIDTRAEHLESTFGDRWCVSSVHHDFRHSTRWLSEWPPLRTRCRRWSDGGRKRVGRRGGGPRGSTCVSACNSYLQFKCPSGPVWNKCACVCVCAHRFMCVRVRGIPSSVDRALPTGRPVLNI